MPPRHIKFAESPCFRVIFPDTVSIAALSEATIYPSLFFPIMSGLKPKGSLSAYSVSFMSMAEVSYEDVYRRIISKYASNN